MKEEYSEPISDLPRINFSCSNAGLCTGEYNDFNVTGDYIINFFTQDQAYQLASPVSITINQARSISAVYDPTFGVLTLNDVLVSNQHYRVELFNRGDFNFHIGTVLPLTQSASDNPAIYDHSSQLLHIPRVSVQDSAYLVDMFNQGGYVFILNNVTEIAP